MAIFGKKRSTERERVHQVLSNPEGAATDAGAGGGGNAGAIQANAPLSGLIPGRPAGIMSRIVSHNRSESDPHDTAQAGSSGMAARTAAESHPAFGASPVPQLSQSMPAGSTVSYTHLRAHET